MVRIANSNSDWRMSLPMGGLRSERAAEHDEGARTAHVACFRRIGEAGDASVERAVVGVRDPATDCPVRRELVLQRDALVRVAGIASAVAQWRDELRGV